MAGNILILGYGNVDRQDDGVAWHILNQIAALFEIPAPDTGGEEIDLFPYPELPTDGSREPSVGFVKEKGIDLAFTLQLSPELAESIARYEIVCFVDAHTGNIPQDVNFQELQGGYQASPFTHHLTPQTCLALAQALYGHAPEGYLLSVRGYEFGFSRELSDRTKRLATEGCQLLTGWLNHLDD